MENRPFSETLERVMGHPFIRLIVGLFLTISTMMIVQMVVKAVERFVGKSPLMHALAFSIVGAAAVFGYWLFVRFVERKPFDDFGRTGAWSEWIKGAGIGFALMSLTVGLLAAIGDYKVIGTNGLEVLIPQIGIANLSGFMEETLFRGLLFRHLERWLGSLAALALSAALFGFGHMGNPGATLFSSIAIAIEAGILLGAAYMLTRRLWMAIGIHMAWNFTQGGIWGLAISGAKEKGLIQPDIHGPELLTGGAFGVEASIPALVISTTMGFWLLKRAYDEGQFVKPSWHRFKTGEEPLITA